MGLILGCIVVLVFAAGQEGSLGPDQFISVVKGLASGVDDITFLYEGEVKSLVPESNFSETFQGTYAFRRDGATALDIIRYDNNDVRSYKNNIHALLRGQVQEVTRIPDFNYLRPEVRKGGPGVLNRSASAERFLYYWFFRTMDDPSSHGYRFIGWERIRDRQCLVCEFDLFENDSSSTKAAFRFWIDLDRGGHPVKAVHTLGSETRLVADEIRLDRVELPGGRSIWLPAEARVTTYSGGKPTMSEGYRLVAGSTLINQKLPDERFTLDWKGPLVGTREMQEVRRKLKGPAHRNRTDPAGVQEELDRVLAEADRQAKRLEASSLARGSQWSRWPGSGLLVVGFAAGLLGVFLFLRTRYAR